MAPAHKYYVVWAGHSPGVYDSWQECRLQTSGFPGARYKAFKSREEAVEAYRGDPSAQLDIARAILKHTAESGRCQERVLPAEVRRDAIAIDGACSGNPGRIEYRGVRVADGMEVFHFGAGTPYIGTNNIAEYLAMIHVAALLARSGDYTTPIYTDSKNTLAWLRRGSSNSKLQRTPATAATLDLLARADAWLRTNGPIRNPILKWRTELWGEIPADFDRK